MDKRPPDPGLAGVFLCAITNGKQKKAGQCPAFFCLQTPAYFRKAPMVSKKLTTEMGLAM